MIDLKPCPFCGSDATVKSWMDEDIWTHNIVEWVQVECSGCEITTGAWPESAAQEEVYDIWNARV